MCTGIATLRFSNGPNGATIIVWDRWMLYMYANVYGYTVEPLLVDSPSRRCQPFKYTNIVTLSVKLTELYCVVALTKQGYY